MSTESVMFRSTSIRIVLGETEMPSFESRMNLSKAQVDATQEPSNLTIEISAFGDFAFEYPRPSLLHDHGAG